LDLLFQDEIVKEILRVQKNTSDNNSRVSDMRMQRGGTFTSFREVVVLVVRAFRSTAADCRPCIAPSLLRFWEFRGESLRAQVAPPRKALPLLPSYPSRDDSGLRLVSSAKAGVRGWQYTVATTKRSHQNVPQQQQQ
ncbi:unnamed protein product, partial [Ectocarpus fasciculatus]